MVVQLHHSLCWNWTCDIQYNMNGNCFFHMTGNVLLYKPKMSLHRQKCCWNTHNVSMISSASIHARWLFILLMFWWAVKCLSTNLNVHDKETFVVSIGQNKVKTWPNFEMFTLTTLLYIISQFAVSELFSHCLLIISFVMSSVSLWTYCEEQHPSYLDSSDIFVKIKSKRLMFRSLRATF